MENSKESELTVDKIVDSLFRHLASAMSDLDAFTKDESAYQLEIANRRGQAIVCHELLGYIYDNGYAFTKQEANIIIKAKKKLYPSIYDKSEPVVGS